MPSPGPTRVFSSLSFFAPAWPIDPWPRTPRNMSLLSGTGVIVDRKSQGGETMGKLQTPLSFV